MTGINRNSPFLQNQRIMAKTPIEKIVEDALEVSAETPTVLTPAKEEDENVTSFMALDHKAILDIKNIHIISKEKPGTEKAEDIDKKGDKRDEFDNDKPVIIGEGGSESTGDTNVTTLDDFIDRVEECHKDDVLDLIQNASNGDVTALAELLEYDGITVDVQESADSSHFIATVRCKDAAIQITFDISARNELAAHGFINASGNYSIDDINAFLDACGCQEFGKIVFFIENATEPPSYDLDLNMIKQIYPDKEITNLTELKNHYLNTSPDKQPEFIKNCLETLSEKYKGILKKQGFSDDIIDKMLELVLNTEEYKLDLGDTSYSFGSNVNMFNRLSSFINNVNVLTGGNSNTVSLYADNGTNIVSFNNYSIEAFLYELTKDEYSENLFNNSIQFNFLKNLVDEKIKPLNLTDNELKALINRIAAHIKNEGVSIFNNVRDLQYYGNSPSQRCGWISVINDIVIDETSKINKNIDRNVNEINVDALWENVNNYFGDTSIPNGYIVRHIEDMLLSDDSSVRKFANLIQDLLNRREYVTDSEGNTASFPMFYTSEDKEKVLKYLAQILNKQLGIETDCEFVFTKELFNKLNENGNFEFLENAINSYALETMYQLDIDGKLDHFKQGDIGDCWFLSSIISLSKTITGQEIIRKSIRLNDDLTGYIVTFAGVGESAEISFEEIMNADPDFNYGATYLGEGSSRGDNDALLLEMAWRKLEGRINGSSTGSSSSCNAKDVWDFVFDTDNARTARKFWSLFIPNCSNDKVTASGFDDVFNAVGGLIDLSDGVIDLDEGTVYDALDTIANLGPSFAATFSLLAAGGHTYECQTVDGKTFRCETNAHTLAIKSVDAAHKTVTIINPHNSSEEYTITWARFADMGIARIEWTSFPTDTSARDVYSSMMVNDILSEYDSSLLGDKEQIFLDEISVFKNGTKCSEDYVKMYIQRLYDTLIAENPEDVFVAIFSDKYANEIMNNKFQYYYGRFLCWYDGLDKFPNKTDIVKTPDGDYTCTDKRSLDLFNNLVDVLREIIWDIPLGRFILDYIGGEARLKDLAMNIWNYYNNDMEYTYTEDFFSDIIYTFLTDSEELAKFL